MKNRKNIFDEDDDALNETVVVDERAGNAPEAAASGKQEKRGKRKKLGMGMIFLLLVVGIVMALSFSGFFSGKKEVSVDVPGKSQVPAANSPDTDKAITALGTQLTTGAPVVQQPVAGATQPTTTASPTTGSTTPLTQGPPVTSGMPDSGNQSVTALPGMENTTNGVAGTVQSAPLTTTASTQSVNHTTAAARDVPASQIKSEAATQTSIYFFADPTARRGPAANSSASRTTEAAPQASVGVAPLSVMPMLRRAPVIPPFGSTLPVRSLGAIYSLRGNSYVRLETTRAVEGEGWSLPRGTMLIGRVSGAENDRIFVNLLGYLADGKLVRMSGEVSGVDGGAGLQGERKHIGKRWVKALKEIGSNGVQTFNSWLAGRSGSTQVYLPSNTIRDIQGNYSLQPVTDYVAVSAGTLGNVMITDLPASVNGVQLDAQAGDAEPSLSQPSAKMMSEDEVIDLMTTGTPEQIRAVLPRMPRELQAIALTALKEN